MKSVTSNNSAITYKVPKITLQMFNLEIVINYMLNYIPNKLKEDGNYSDL